MTTFEKCKIIQRMLINNAAEVMVYTNWSLDFAAEKIRKFPNRLREQNTGEDYFNIKPTDLTETEMIDLGFRKWSEASTAWLIPLWLFPFLADEFDAASIDGIEQTMKKSDMDNDSRFGCLAYEVIPKKENPKA